MKKNVLIVALFVFQLEVVALTKTPSLFSKNFTNTLSRNKTLFGLAGLATLWAGKTYGPDVLKTITQKFKKNISFNTTETSQPSEQNTQQISLNFKPLQDTSSIQEENFLLQKQEDQNKILARMHEERIAREEEQQETQKKIDSDAALLEAQKEKDDEQLLLKTREEETSKERIKNQKAELASLEKELSGLKEYKKKLFGGQSEDIEKNKAINNLLKEIAQLNKKTFDEEKIKEISDKANAIKNPKNAVAAKIKQALIVQKEKAKLDAEIKKAQNDLAEISIKAEQMKFYDYPQVLRDIFELEKEINEENNIEKLKIIIETKVKTLQEKIKNEEELSKKAKNDKLAAEKAEEAKRPKRTFKEWREDLRGKSKTETVLEKDKIAKAAKEETKLIEQIKADDWKKRINELNNLLKKINVLSKKADEASFNKTEINSLEKDIEKLMKKYNKAKKETIEDVKNEINDFIAETENKLKEIEIEIEKKITKIKTYKDIVNTFNKKGFFADLLSKKQPKKGKEEYKNDLKKNTQDLIEFIEKATSKKSSHNFNKIKSSLKKLGISDFDKTVDLIEEKQDSDESHIRILFYFTIITLQEKIKSLDENKDAILIKILKKSIASFQEAFKDNQIDELIKKIKSLKLEDIRDFYKQEILLFFKSLNIENNSIYYEEWKKFSKNTSFENKDLINFIITILSKDIKSDLISDILNKFNESEYEISSLYTNNVTKTVVELIKELDKKSIKQAESEKLYSTHIKPVFDLLNIPDKLKEFKKLSKVGSNTDFNYPYLISVINFIKENLKINKTKESKKALKLVNDFYDKIIKEEIKDLLTKIKDLKDINESKYLFDEKIEPILKYQLKITSTYSEKKKWMDLSTLDKDNKINTAALINFIRNKINEENILENAETELLETETKNLIESIIQNKIDVENIDFYENNIVPFFTLLGIKKLDENLKIRWNYIQKNAKEINLSDGNYHIMLLSFLLEQLNSNTINNKNIEKAYEILYLKYKELIEKEFIHLIKEIKNNDISSLKSFFSSLNINSEYKFQNKNYSYNYNFDNYQNKDYLTDKYQNKKEYFDSIIKILKDINSNNEEAKICLDALNKNYPEYFNKKNINLKKTLTNINYPSFKSEQQNTKKPQPQHPQNKFNLGSASEDSEDEDIEIAKKLSLEENYNSQKKKNKK